MGCNFSMCQNFNILGESGTDEAECHEKLASGRSVVYAIWSPINARGLQLMCAMVLHEILLVPFLMQGNGTGLEEVQSEGCTDG